MGSPDNPALDAANGNHGFVLNWRCAQTGNNGTIEHRNYGNNEMEKWDVSATCDKVRIISTHFDTEPIMDILMINNRPYTGSIIIDQLITS